jgi:hypothetical protein
MAKIESIRQVPPGFKEDIIRFSVANVSEVMVATQMTGMQTATSYLLKDVEVYFSGTALADAYLDVNTAATDVAATKLAGRYYQTGSFIHFDGEGNGIINGNLSAKPYLQLSAGVGSAAQTVYCTVHYYYYN